MAMNAQNYVAAWGQGWVVVVNGQRVAGDNADESWSSQSAAEQKYNSLTNGGTNIGGRATGGTVTEEQLAVWLAGMKGGATEAQARAFIAQYGRLPANMAEWTAFQAAQGGGPGGPGGGSYQALIDAILGTNREEFDYKKQQDARVLYAGLIQGLTGTAAGLTGPRDWLKYQQYTGGGRTMAQQLFGDARPAFSPPTGTSEPRTLEDLLRDLGLIPAGGGGASGGAGGDDTALLDYIWAHRPDLLPFYTQNGWQAGTPDQQRAIVRDWLKNNNATAAQTAADLGYTGAAAAGTAAGDAGGSFNVSLPFQINPGVWEAAPDSWKQMILAKVEKGQAEGGAWDPGDWLQQMYAARPRGTARVGQTRYALGGRY